MGDKKLYKVWSKSNLKKSDAQQSKQGSNPTGNLRLSQADYRGAIDQTTYFRNEVFKNLSWSNFLGSEVAYGSFYFIIDGVYKGCYKLRITHELHRESNQNNVTTILHWGDAINMIRQSNIKGKKLTLYKYPEQLDSFVIEIS